MSTITEHFTDQDFQHALKRGISPDVVARQYLRQHREIQLAAARTDVTAVYFPRATMTRTERLARWIKKVVR